VWAGVFQSCFEKSKIYVYEDVCIRNAYRVAGAADPEQDQDEVSLPLWHQEEEKCKLRNETTCRLVTKDASIIRALAFVSSFHMYP
jgi:hypothetical protein